MPTESPALPLTGRTALACAAVLGLACGALDALLALLRRVPSFEDLGLALAAAFATALAAAALHAGLWRLAGARICARLRLMQAPSAIALAVWIGTTFLLVRCADVPGDGMTNAAWFMVMLMAAFGAAFAAGGYLATAALEADRRRCERAVAIAIATPALLLLAVPFLWAQIFAVESAASAAGVAITAAFAAAVAGTAWYAGSAPGRARAVRATQFVAAAAFAIPLAIAGWSAAAGYFDRAGTTPHAVRHVILVTADTMRADVLAAYGNPRVRTPALDALARDGVVFERAISAAPWTLPSVSTLLTGVTPAVHLVRLEHGRLPDRLSTMAERFSAAGYRTAAIVDNAYLRPKSNLNQGFDDYEFLNVPEYGNSPGAWLLRRALPGVYRAARPVTADEQTARVKRWIARNADRDFFLWVHYFDPHTPYEPPRRFVSGEPPPGMGWDFSPPPQVMSGLIARGERDRNWIRALYEGEVAWLDENVGAVLDQLRALGLYDDALIAFTSDHGEEFWEHGGQGHAHTLYDELLHVPLIVKAPGLYAGSRVPEPVSTARLVPTLLEAADVEHEPGDFSAPSLSGLVRTDAAARPAPIVSGATLVVDDLESVIFDGMKYIHSRVTGREELYRLQDDPGERASLAATEPGALDTARGLLAADAADAQRLRGRVGIVDADTGALDEATLNRLRGLGYIQ
ncbi:MAG: sulfatase [Gammaproteobacteria bacterium]